MDISYSHDRACEGYRFTNRELPMPIGGFNLFHVVESSYAHHLLLACTHFMWGKAAMPITGHLQADFI